MSMSMESASHGVSDEQIQRYHRDGYLVVPDLFAPELMLEWKRRVKDMLGPAPGAVKVWMCDTLPEYFHEGMADPRKVQILRRIIGDLERRLAIERGHPNICPPIFDFDIADAILVWRHAEVSPVRRQL